MEQNTKRLGAKWTEKRRATFYKFNCVWNSSKGNVVLIVIAAIFTMLCERTAGMLSNLCL